MSNTIVTLLTTGCYVVVDRCVAWGYLPFWPMLIVALTLAVLIGWHMDKAIRQWLRSHKA